MIIRSQPQECEECGWALAVSRLAWWRSRAGRSMVKGQIVCLKLGGGRHTLSQALTYQWMSEYTFSSDVEKCLDDEMIKLDFCNAFNISVSSRKLTSYSQRHFPVLFL